MMQKNTAYLKFSSGLNINKHQLLKKLLPGLLPLVVFILVDEFYGTAAGLVVAVCFGIAQLIFIYIKDRVFDKFTLFDTLLIIILGLISYFLDNEIFFKLKPALISAILCILLGISAFSKLNIFALMSKRYMKGIDFNDGQVRQLKHSLKILFFIFTFHTLLVLYSAFFMSKEVWAFISTALFYILFGVYFIYELLRNKIKNNRYKKEEWLPLVDEQGNLTGRAPRSVVHNNKNLLHPVVHLIVINKKKQVYLQKRPMKKLSCPGMWDASVTGHVSVNENIENALNREAEEEIGITNFSAVPVCKYILKTESESELVFLFHTGYEGEIKFNSAEVNDGRFWRISEIKNHLGTGIFTPGFETDYNILKRSSII